MKQELTKLYEGIIGLAKVTAGKECNYRDYMEIKNEFRYPGVLLERMEEKGYTSVSDYISVMAGLRIVKDYENAATFVGTQLEDFLVRAREKALKEKSIMLLFQVLSFSKNENKPVLSEDEITSVIDLSKEIPLEESFSFLIELMSGRSRYMDTTKGNAKNAIAKGILENCIPKLPRFDVIGNKELFIDVILSMNDICSSFQYEDKDVLEFYGKELGEKILAFEDLYEEPLKKKYEKVLKKMGFSDMDILDLNFGIWHLSSLKPVASSSPIKWWRLKRKWFQALFLQDKEIPFPDDIKRFLTERMPQKIDGKTMPREFLLDSFSGEIPNVQNSYLLFDFLTMPISMEDFRCDGYNRVNRMHLWKHYLCKNHKLSVLSTDDLEWVKGLVSYLYPSKIPYYGAESSRNLQLYTEILSECMEQNVVSEKADIIKEIFQTDVHTFIYQHPGYFSRKDVVSLFESSFLDLSACYQENSGACAKYLEDMEHKFQLEFLQDFCESRNWVFTDDEAKFLEKFAENNWVIHIAYTWEDLKMHFDAFSDEEKELLLGLACEMCTRIPEICNLDFLMAGFIAHKESRDIIGEETAQQWYQILQDRASFCYKDSLDRDFLSEEEYEKIQKQKKELEEKEEKDAFSEAVKKETDSLFAKMKGLSLTESLKVYAGALPSYVCWSKKETLAALDVFLELFYPEEDLSKTDEEKEKHYLADKKTLSKIWKFFVECYENDYLTKDTLIEYIELLEEEK